MLVQLKEKKVSCVVSTDFSAWMIYQTKIDLKMKKCQKYYCCPLLTLSIGFSIGGNYLEFASSSLLHLRFLTLSAK